MNRARGPPQPGEQTGAMRRSSSVQTAVWLEIGSTPKARSHGMASFTSEMKKAIRASQRDAARRDASGVKRRRQPESRRAWNANTSGRWLRTSGRLWQLKADARAQANAQKRPRADTRIDGGQGRIDDPDVATRLEEIDAILAATLDVNDHMDLDALRLTVERPQFTSTTAPIPPPDRWWFRRSPQYLAPPEPTGMFGKKKRYAEAVRRPQPTTTIGTRCGRRR